MARISLTRLTEDDREQFIRDNQRAFQYGAMEEFGERDSHFEEDGEIISREIIETDRLLLRPFKESDAADVYEYLKEPAVNCFACMKLPSLAEAKREMKRRMKTPDYYFAVVLKESGKVIGEFFGEPESVGSEGDPRENDTFSPCWMLNKAYQGKGYAFEAAKAYFDYLFHEKGMRRLYACTEDDNLPSQRLCEKLGMRREGLFREYVSFVNNSDGSPRYENTLQYAILKKEWR